MKNYIITISAALMLGSVFCANAQNDQGAAAFLSIPVDARSAGMALTGVASDNGAFNLYHNTANFIYSDKQYGAAFSYGPQLTEIKSGSNLFSLAGFYNIDRKNIVSAGLRYYMDAKGEMTNDAGAPQDYRPKGIAVDLGYARHIIDGLSAGVNVKWVMSSMDMPGLDKANAVAFDIGIAYRRPMNFIYGADWGIGLSMKNLGSKIDYGFGGYDLPGMLDFGGSVNLPFNENHKLSAALDLGYQVIPSDASVFEGGLGAEYTFLGHGVVRAGYHLGDKEKGWGNFATVGLGFLVGPVKGDFSYWITDSDSALKNTLCVSLGVYF